MKRSLNSLLTSTLVAFVLAGVPALRAVETNMPPATGDTVPTKAKKTTYPFYGTVDSASASAGTVSIKKKEGVRLLKTDEKSKLTVNGKEATLTEVKAGLYAHGTVRKDTTGAEVIVKAKFDSEAPKAMSDAGTNATNAVTGVVKKSKKAKAAATNAVDQAVSPMVK